MTDPTSPEDARLLISLAQALVTSPRATLQEVAKAAGVSKATLYRFSRTREELVDRLLNYGALLIHETMKQVDLTSGHPRETLRRLVSALLEHRTMVAFMNAYWRPDVELDPEGTTSWQEFEALSDAFFLRGQREGVFRIDISAAAMSEALGGLLCMFVDAELRGRIAPASMGTTLESLFLDGAASR